MEVKDLTTGTTIESARLPVPPDLLGTPGLGYPDAPPDANNSKYLVTGVPGVGKSTLAASNPKAIWVDLDGSMDKVPDPKALPWRPPASGRVTEALDAFILKILNRGPKDFNMVWFDTYDKLVSLLQHDVMEKHNLTDLGDFKGGRGKGYRIVNDGIFAFLDKLARRGFGVGLIAHMTETRGENGVIERHLAVSDSYRTAARRWVDHLLHVEYRQPVIQIPTGGGKFIEQPDLSRPVVRGLALQPGGANRKGSIDDVKVRLPFCDFLELPEMGGWRVFTTEHDASVARRTEKQKAFDS